MKIRDIQEALTKAGYLPGPIDGIWGRQTATAVRAFQKDKGLQVDGVVGPQTAAALAAIGQAGAAADPGNLPLVWLAEASRLINTKEDPATGRSNPIILEWADELGVDRIYTTDDIPWCGLFVAHCIGSTLPAEPLPSGLLAARSWSRFGIPVEPTRGAIMVFYRKSPQSGLGHVGFYLGEDATAYCILGGNQSNSVSVTWIAKSRLIGARWPSTFSPPLSGRTQLASRTGDLSINEA
ncbi:NlpC/P60 family protein [Novosphingobium cyanobacteriorum]|nr:TIGR02594 family protein [Novosphingobium cyanobacteriorum]